MDVLVSACIITYNQVNYIRDCIEGALMQEVDFGYEIVIADDCSTDGTSEICANYAAKFPNLIRHLRRDKNLGPNRNVLKAYGECKGKYIAVCEGDDYWIEKNKITYQVKFLEENLDYSMICHRLDAAKKFTVASTFSIANLYQEYYLPHTSNYCFRNIDLDKFSGILAVIPGGETALLYVNTTHGKIYYSDKVVSEYRIHDGGIHTSATKEWTSRSLLLQNRLIRNIVSIDRNAYFLRQIQFAKNVRLITFLQYLISNYSLIDLLELKVMAARFGFSFRSTWGRFNKKVHYVLKTAINRLLASNLNYLSSSRSIANVEVLFKDDAHVTQSPKGKQYLEHERKNLNLYHVKDVIVHPDISIYRIKGKYFTNQNSILGIRNVKYETDLVPYGRNNKVRVNYPNEIIEVDKAIVLSGFGSFNYFHLLLENVLRLFLIKDVGQIKVLMPHSVSTVLPAEWLDFFRANYNVQLMEPNCSYRVKNCLIPDYFVNTPFDITDKYTCDSKDYSIAANAFEIVRNRLVKRLEKYFGDNTKELEKYHRVYIKREKGRRTFINQDALIEVLRDRGFEVLEPSTLTLHQQYGIFRSARVIVGGSGAALTNLIFAQPGTKVISWLPERLKCFSVYSTITALCDIEFMNITYIPHTRNIHSSYSLDLNKVCELIDLACNEVD